MNDMKLDTRKLRQLREARAWSQERLAEAAGLSSRTVQRVEADGRAAAETALALAAALDVPVATLSVAEASSPTADGIIATGTPAPDAPAPAVTRTADPKRRLSRHLLIYLLVSAALLYRDLHLDGQLNWAAWPIAGWGLALLLRAWRQRAQAPTGGRTQTG